MASLQELFERIEKQCPELSSAVTIVVKKIVSLRPCVSEPHAIEARCAELILAIEDLGKLFPDRMLTKSEALACLNSIQPPNPQIMASAKHWSMLANAGTRSMNHSLIKYIDSLREMYTENRYAVDMYGSK